LRLTEDPAPRGHAFEFRLNAEDVGRGFLPSPGTIGEFAGPTGPGIRLDTGVRSGSFVAPQFDSLLAKLIVTGADRQQALRRARRALAEMRITGVATVLPFHRAVLESPDFTSEDGLGIHTRWIETDFADSSTISADPDYSTTAPDGERRTITVDVDGRRLAVGLPADLLDGWARSGGPVPAGVSLEAASDGGAGAADPGELRADMAGTVVKWLVEPGAEVSAGDPVVVLEAMKMETQVSAHRDGTVTDVRTGAGGVVAAGAVLALIG
jgi:acetyl-CoA/propionyl-CoA carboxylase biotin carboxyl carrier protein